MSTGHPELVEIEALLAEVAADLTTGDRAEAPGATPPQEPEHRLDIRPEEASRGLAQLVLTVVELLRQLMERQAVRRMEAGGLSEEQEERLGLTLMRLAERMEELKAHFGLSTEDLNLDLGPLGRLL